MADIELLDVSFRDGNQSLWGATGLTTGQILQIAPVMDRVGFRALDFTSSTHMGIAVRTHRENPWERIRLVHAAMPRTPLQFIGTGFRFVSWESASAEVMRLVYDRLVANGMTRFIVLDPMHDMAAIRRTARFIRQAGGQEIVGALTYTISEVHDDAFYAGLAAGMAGCPDIDRVYVKDPAGLLTPERARTLIPAVRDRLGGKPLELHSHCTLGLSPLTCLAAAADGVGVLHVACGPLSNGSSLPDAQRLAANLRELGYRVTLDDRALARGNDMMRSRTSGSTGAVGRPNVPSTYRMT
jgi:oxaloacetate decarboxylase (Na+ extruding) subunit alpha